MADSIKSVFEEECGDVRIDNRLIDRVHRYAQNFINKNEDHVAFFGGNLLGVYPVRYVQADRDLWFDDVLEIDDISLKNRLHSIPTLDPSYKRASDTVNLSCTWLLHAIFHANNLSVEKREQGLLDVLVIMQAKFLTSLMAHYFRYPADKAVALATYAALSKKYALKVHGSWLALLTARSKDILARSSVHYQTLVNYDDDKAIVYLIEDTQGRIREVVKKMTAVFYQIRDSDGRITTTSSMTLSVDGELVVRDKTRNYTAYKRYLHEVVSNKSSFIRNELVDIIANAMHTMPERFLMETLAYMADNYRVRGETDIETLLNETLLHAFDFLSNNRSAMVNSNDLAGLVSKLRAIYMSSRSTDPVLLKMRDVSERIVGHAIKSRNPSVIAAVRTGVMLYLVLRAFTMKHYS